MTAEPKSPTITLLLSLVTVAVTSSSVMLAPDLSARMAQLPIPVAFTVPFFTVTVAFLTSRTPSDDHVLELDSVLPFRSKVMLLLMVTYVSPRSTSLSSVTVSPSCAAFSAAGRDSYVPPSAPSALVTEAAVGSLTVSATVADRSSS